MLDFSDKTPDRILLWIRLYGENSRLDIRSIKFELRYDENVTLAVPESCQVVSAGEPMPEMTFSVRGEIGQVNAAYTAPDGKRRKLTLKNNGGHVKLPDLKPECGVYHFTIGGAGRRERIGSGRCPACVPA